MGMGVQNSVFLYRPTGDLPRIQSGIHCHECDRLAFSSELLPGLLVFLHGHIEKKDINTSKVDRDKQ